MQGIFVFKCRPGVYKMSNKVSNNFYIGSSKNVSHRIKTHKYELRHGYKGNIRIRADLEKYGVDSFVFESLEYCDQSVIKKREQYHFERLNPSYNVWKNVYSACGRSYTREQLTNSFPKREIKDKDSFKKKLKEAWKIRRLRSDGISTLKMLDRTGKFHSEETKKLMKLNRKGISKSESTKEKIRLKRLGTKWDSENKTWIKKEVVNGNKNI
jgi:group I intron endonuclease